MIVYFVSGHRNITPEEFKEHYVPKLDKAMKECSVRFVVGDCEGVDIMATKYLYEKGADVTIYHMFVSPRFLIKHIDENYNHEVKLKGGYTSDFDRDFTMTKESDYDIAWVRYKRSGTQQNLDRRIWMNERLKQRLPITQHDLLMRETGNFL